jgi:hypothetical protein
MQDISRTNGFKQIRSHVDAREFTLAALRSLGARLTPRREIELVSGSLI